MSRNLSNGRERIIRSGYIYRLSLAVLCFAGLACLTGCGYNEILARDESAQKAWGDLQAQLQRRADLVPNLVETVKGFAAHERETLEAVIEARSRATSIQVTNEMIEDEQALARFREAQAALSSSIGRLLAVAEQYPELKSNQNFLDLQHQLEGTENRISVARQRYNEQVEVFNITIRRFPNSLTNSILLRLETKKYFQADESAQAAPKVQF